MSSIIRSQAADVPYNMTATGFDLPGYRIVANLGVVRGVVVRSRSVFGTFGAGIQTIFGGNITLFTELAERTRQQAFETMLVQADVVLSGLEKESNYDACEDVIQEIQVKVVKFLSNIQLSEEVALPRLDSDLGESIPISFLGYEVDHSIYPLEGGHEEAASHNLRFTRQAAGH